MSMTTSLLSLFARPASRTTIRTPRPAAAATSTGGMIEALEDRQFFSIAPAAAPAVGDAVLKTQTAQFANKVAKNGTTTVLPLTITGINVVNNQLVAVGNIGGQTVSLPITLGTSPNPADPSCPILDLELGPINLNLLGLNVETSPICLDITAERGPGNLLGNLLCGLTNALNATPTPALGNVLGALPAADRTALLGGLTGILNGALGRILSPTSIVGTDQTPPAAQAGAVDILNLSLGPVDLNLLGLDVELDNCDGGPITVDITAVPGPGNLLGNLLGGVARLLDNPSNPNALANAINRLARAIRGLV
jgi:hypothetical protein